MRVRADLRPDEPGQSLELPRVLQQQRGNPCFLCADTNAAHVPSGQITAASLCQQAREQFRDWLSAIRECGSLLVLAHHDADGVAAAAILARWLRTAGRPVHVRIVGRGESAWSTEMRRELEAASDVAGIIATDLGVQSDPILPGKPTILIDHHVPAATETASTIVTGYGSEPIPTSSLLAYWCVSAIVDPDPLLWIAVLGIIGDIAEKAGFTELEEARVRYGITPLRRAVALINAARRSASGDAGPALALLMKASGPDDISSGKFAETAVLIRAQEEVKHEMDNARRVPPKVRNGIALIRLHSPCQIHPLIAQQWRGRFKNEIVIAVNTGYTPGSVHFAVRSARDLDLIEFLASHAPPDADSGYGHGHRAANGGALRPEAWNEFVSDLGFGIEDHVR